jgi:asparagine synthase (glutamine-hydrolysing)
METCDGRYGLVFNGEVYNFTELREELRKKGEQFRSSGDTEVVLHLLARKGASGLAELNGMFALALYDRLEERILLARDHAGIKPLYYLLTTRGLVFASQYDQILGHPWAQALPVSDAALGLYLRLGYIPAPYALLENTYMLEPGCWLDISSNGGVRSGRFFEFPQFREPDLKGDEADEAVDEAVARAVKRQLVSDVPLGTFLSGGIDSPLVAAKMRSASREPVHAFTIGVKGDLLDESPDAIRYASEIGLNHTVEHVTSDQALAMLDDVVEACGEPFADYSIFPTMLVSRIARKKVTVMLSGDGGDELFWGYASRFAPVLEQLSSLADQPFWLRKLHWSMRRVLHLHRGHSGLRYASVGEWYRQMHCRLSEDQLRAIFQRVPEWPTQWELYRSEHADTERTAQWMRWNEFVGHLTMVLLKVDRASMYNSLEVRVPLLDREVVEVASRINWATCLDTRRRIGKRPLRRALSRHVQHQSLSKRGFEVPMAAWLRGPLRSVVEEVLLPRQDLLGVPLNSTAIRSLFNQHIGGRQDHSRGLWTLLSLALWQEHHFHRRGEERFSEDASLCVPVH